MGVEAGVRGCHSAPPLPPADGCCLAMPCPEKVCSLASEPRHVPWASGDPVKGRVGRLCPVKGGVTGSLGHAAA